MVGTLKCVQNWVQGRTRVHQTLDGLKTIPKHDLFGRTEPVHVIIGCENHHVQTEWQVTGVEHQRHCYKKLDDLLLRLKVSWIKRSCAGSLLKMECIDDQRVAEANDNHGEEHVHGNHNDHCVVHRLRCILIRPRALTTAGDFVEGRLHERWYLQNACCNPCRGQRVYHVVFVYPWRFKRLHDGVITLRRQQNQRVHGHPERDARHVIGGKKFAQPYACFSRWVAVDQIEESLWK